MAVFRTVQRQRMLPVPRQWQASTVEWLEERRLFSAITSWASRGPGGGGAFFSPSFSPYTAQELYTVSDMSGLYHSTNLGQSWSVADWRQIQGGIGSQVQFTADPNILYTLDYADTSSGGSSTAPSRSADGGKTWAQVPGWNGSNDQAYSIFADPQNTTSLLVTDYGSLYFSSNGGQSFTSVYTDASGQGCYVGGVVWNGSNVYVGVDSGLIVSSNGGASFSAATVSGLPAGSSILSFTGATQNGVTRLACITANSGDVFNGLETGSIPQGSYSGTWTLTPGQTSWTAATSVPAADGPLLISMARNDINDIYIGGTNYALSVPIVAKSTDGGKTFADVLNVVNNGNVATGWQGASGDRQWSFDQLTEGFQVSPLNSNNIAFTGYGYLHLSTDGGKTWRQAYVNSADQNPAGSNTPTQKPYHGVGLEDTSTLYLNWASQQTIMAGYTDINGVRSTDGGQSWSFPSGVTLAGNTIYCVVKQGTTLYAATSNTHDIYQSTHVTDASLNSGTGNVLYSTDNGATWNVFHNFSHPVIWVATDPNDANRLYASLISSTAGGIYTTDNLSAGVNATWTQCAAPPRTQGHPFNIAVLHDGSVVATYSGRRSGSSFTDSSGVFVSTDHGQTWTDRTGAGMHWWTKDIVVDPTDSTQNTWYAAVRFAYGTTGASGTGGLYRTTNRGQTWTQVFQSIGAESAAVSPSTGEMYVSTEEDGLWYSANPKAATPAFVQTTYPFRQPERIFFNPYNANEVWVTSFGYGLTVGNVTAVAPTLATSQVGGGGDQRSTITSLQVGFNAPVNLSSASFTVQYESVADNIAFQNQTAASQTFTSLSNATDISFSTTDGGTTWVLRPMLNGVVDRTLGNGNSAGQAILADGIYRLVVHGSAVTDAATSTAAYNGGLDQTVSFNDGIGAPHSDFGVLFGDLAGTGIVNNSDVTQLRNTFVGGTGTYNAAFDYRGIESQLSNSDVTQFKKRFLVMLQV